MAGNQGNRFFPDGIAEQLQMVPIQAVPTPTGNNIVIWNVMEDLFNVIILD
jgi:hypothetical protein